MKFKITRVQVYEVEEEFPLDDSLTPDDILGSLHNHFLDEQDVMQESSDGKIEFTPRQFIDGPKIELIEE